MQWVAPSLPRSKIEKRAIDNITTGKILRITLQKKIGKKFNSIPGNSVHKNRLFFYICIRINTLRYTINKTYKTCKNTFK